jgi:hypothetical protein
MEQDAVLAKLHRCADRLVFDTSPVLAFMERIDTIFSPYRRERAKKLRRIARFLCEHMPESIENSIAGKRSNVVFSDRDPGLMRRDTLEEHLVLLDNRMRELRLASDEVLHLLLHKNPLGSRDTTSLLCRYHAKGSAALDTLRFIRLLPAEDIALHTRDTKSFDTLMHVMDFLRLRRDHQRKTGRFDGNHDAGVAAAARFLAPSKHYKYVDADLLDFVFEFPDKVDGVEQYLTDFRLLITDEVDFDHLMEYLGNDNTVLREGML